MSEAAAERPSRTPTRPATRRRKPATRTRSVPTSAPPPSRAAGNNKWLELVMSLIQAPLGLATSQGERLVTELVRTGNLGQREAERLLGELRSTPERAHGRAQQESARLDRFIESRIEVVLNRVNIPTRSDIERLNNSVDLLTAKVEALVGRQVRGAH